jgi:hypothetical protein
VLLLLHDLHRVAGGRLFLSLAANPNRGLRSGSEANWRRRPNGDGGLYIHLTEP